MKTLQTGCHIVGREEKQGFALKYLAIAFSGFLIPHAGCTAQAPSSSNEAIEGQNRCSSASKRESSQHSSKESSTPAMSLDERFNTKWKIRTSKIVLSPKQTPYDDNEAVRRSYLDGFKDGVETAIREKWSPSVVDFKRPSNVLEEARIEGFNQGRTNIQKIVDDILKEIQEDLNREIREKNRK